MRWLHFCNQRIFLLKNNRDGGNMKFQTVIRTINEQPKRVIQ